MFPRREQRRLLTFVIALVVTVSFLAFLHSTGAHIATPQPTWLRTAPPDIYHMTEIEHVARLRKITSGREYATPPLKAHERSTPSPLAHGTVPCRAQTPPPDLEHTGKRALVLYSITHRDQGPVHSMEMDNFAFFAQHGLFPSSLRTALFTQVDYVVVRVAATDGDIHDYTDDSMDTNVRMLILPHGPCDICSTARVLRYLGVGHESTTYSYIVSMNSGSRGPFFTMPPPREDNGAREPYTWIDHMALGGEDQFSKDVITASAASLQWITHFQTYAFGLPTAALKGMGPFFDNTCKFVDKDGCIYAGELFSARVAFKSSLRVRSLIHHPTKAFSDEDTFTQFINATDIPSPLVSRVVKPCQMMFVKFGGDTFEHSRFQKQYVETMLAQTIAQVRVAMHVPVAEDATTLFGRAYFGANRKLKLHHRHP